MTQHAAHDAHELAEILARFAEEYPTDTDEAETVELQLADGSDSPPPAVTLQAGQLAWLTQLVERELATTRNAHCDGDGRCAHCEATGLARRSERASITQTGAP